MLFRSTGIWSFTLTPATLGDKTDIRGSIEIKETEGTTGGAADGSARDEPLPAHQEGEEDSDQGTCEQVFSLEAKVKIFGAGPVVERFIEKQTRDTQNRAAAFFNRVLDGEE